MNRYVFYISAPKWGDDPDTIYFENFHKLKSDLDMPTPITEGLLRLLGAEHDIVKTAMEDAEILHKMNLRQRYAISKGPFMVLLDVDATREMLEGVMTGKHRDGTLKEFLKRAKL